MNEKKLNELSDLIRQLNKTDKLIESFKRDQEHYYQEENEMLELYYKEIPPELASDLFKEFKYFLEESRIQIANKIKAKLREATNE